ncbi:hypothetical protein AB0L80_27475 [Streptomyces sp. NPDC052069]|uniref:hypothetical protein n=1 Tax=Streptomyces sp. NPDC052069 TaxID=3154650 RepID=UPI0034417219
MGDAAAKDWLQRNADDVVVEMLFGPVEEECGPTSDGGRPAVGTKAGTRLPDDVLAALWTHGPRPRAPDRAQMIRSLVTAGLQPA